MTGCLPCVSKRWAFIVAQANEKRRVAQLNMLSVLCNAIYSLLSVATSAPANATSSLPLGPLPTAAMV